MPSEWASAKEARDHFIAEKKKLMAENPPMVSRHTDDARRLIRNWMDPKVTTEQLCDTRSGVFRSCHRGLVLNTDYVDLDEPELSRMLRRLEELGYTVTFSLSSISIRNSAFD